MLSAMIQMIPPTHASSHSSAMNFNMSTEYTPGEVYAFYETPLGAAQKDPCLGLEVAEVAPVWSA